MSETTILALFDDMDPAAEAVEKLRELGLTDSQINVISGVPVMERILGRPPHATNVPRLASAGAVAGLGVGFFLNYGTPIMYAIPVGGQPMLPIPPGMILLFEMMMLFMLLATFLGVFLDSYFPNYRPLQYVPEISDGKIGVYFRCTAGDSEKFTAVMTELGAEAVKPAEAMQL
jgi:hypothetical protein